jgi:hypothetical protein
MRLFWFWGIGLLFWLLLGSYHCIFVVFDMVMDLFWGLTISSLFMICFFQYLVSWISSELELLLLNDFDWLFSNNLIFQV